MVGVNDTHQDYVTMASQLATASDDAIFEIYHRLRQQRRLSATVHGLNALLRDSRSRSVATEALRRLGLGAGG